VSKKGETKSQNSLE